MKVKKLFFSLSEIDPAPEGDETEDKENTFGEARSGGRGMGPWAGGFLWHRGEYVGRLTLRPFGAHLGTRPASKAQKVCVLEFSLQVQSAQ